MPRLYERPESSSWYAEISVAGHSKRVSTGIPKGARNRRKAEQAAGRIEGELNAQLKTGMPFKRAVVRYLAEAKKRESTLSYYEIYFTRLMVSKPDLSLSEITPTFLRDYISDELKAGRGEPTIRLGVAALGSLMTMAVEERWEGAPEVNPLKLISLKRIASSNEGPRRWLSPETVRAILSKAPLRFWKPFLTLILETGMRKEEALGLTWDEVDLKIGFIDLPALRTKNGKGRVIPLTSTALNTLKALVGTHDAPYVFINPRTRTRYRRIYDVWQKLVREAGYPGTRIHDLRHTFGSWTRQSGLAKEDRKEIMGHSDDRAHEGYSKTRIELLRRQLEQHSPSTILAQSHLTVVGDDMENLSVARD